MKKFQFRMQRILDIREKLELEQKNKLAKAASEYQKVLQKQEDKLNFLITERQKIYTDMQDKKISIQALRYIDQLQTQTDSYALLLSPEIEEKQKIMEQEREKYNKLHQEKKLIENLKEKELHKHKLLLQKAENMEMDEIAKNYSK